MQITKGESLGWILATAVAIMLFIGMKAGWSARRGYAFAQTGLVAVPLVMKGAHSFWLWLQRRG